MKKSNLIVAGIAVIVVSLAVALGTYTNDRMMEKVATKMEAEEMANKPMETYALQFLSGIAYQPGQPTTLDFTVVDKEDRRLRYELYKIEHEKRMHVIVASQDLSQFQHVHPIFDTGTNSFKLPDFVFPTAGKYRVFTDFVVNNHNAMSANTMSSHAGVQYQDVIVGNPNQNDIHPLGPATTSAAVDGNTVDLAIKPGKSATTKVLEFSITRDGKPVTNLQKYLGALGHLVVLREGDLEYIHTHALTTNVNNQTGTVSFEVDFKQAGNYKAFAQFQKDNQVLTASFVIKVD